MADVTPLAPPVNVEVSVSQMALTRDTLPGGFLDRLQAIMTSVAQTVLAEPPTRAHHSQRALYARDVMARPPQAAQQVAPQVSQAPQVIQNTTYDPATKAATCSLPDQALKAEVTSLWDNLAGIDQGS